VRVQLTRRRLDRQGEPTRTPKPAPAVAARVKRSSTTVYASWNGATRVSGWRVLGGPAPGALKPVRAVGRSAFETAIRISRAFRYVAVQSLGSHERVLASSRTIKVP